MANPGRTLEHLDLRVGDTANWRWINTSDADHAMHMHGFYFQVNGIGDQDHFAAYKPAERPTVVTCRKCFPEPPSTWLGLLNAPAHRWIMHCHFTIHMMIGDLPNYPVSDTYTLENAGMAGLILGVNVLPAAKPRRLHPASHLLKFTDIASSSATGLPPRAPSPDTASISSSPATKRPQTNSRPLAIL